MRRRRVLGCAIVASVVAHSLGTPGIVAAKEGELEVESRLPPGGEESLAVGEQGDWLPGKVSAGVVLTSNYVYRGITLTDNNPAIQGIL